MEPLSLRVLNSMKTLSKYIFLFMLLNASTFKCQDSLHVTLQMNNDTIRVFEDLSFRITMQSTYPGNVLIAPSRYNGIIVDTLRYIYYELQRKKGKDYEDVFPFKNEVDLSPESYNEPDTLKGFTQKIINDHLIRFHIQKGYYRLQIVCAVTIYGVSKIFFSNYVYFFCSEHFSS